MNIIKIAEGDILNLKKNHPCGKDSYDFKVIRTGSDIKISCLSCGRQMAVPRVKLEKSIRAVNGEKIQSK